MRRATTWVPLIDAPMMAVICAIGPIGAAAQPALLEQGRLALETRCGRCHAIGLEGDSYHADAPPFRDIVKRYPPEFLEESLAEGIASGHPDMPEFLLSPDEIAAVIAHLKSLEKRQ